MTPSIAVVIPCRNAEATLEECLAAVQPQLGADDQIVLVDDGSGDASAAIARRRGVRVVSLSASHGAAAARNAGAAATTAEVLLFVDADVELRGGVLEAVRALIGQEGEVALHGNLAETTPAADLLSQYKNHYMHSMFERAGSYRSNFFTSCSAVRRAVFEELGGFNENLRGAVVEDREFGYRLNRAGHRVRFDPRIVGLHYKRYTWGHFLATEYLRARDITQMALEVRRQTPGLWRDHIPIGFRLAPALVMLAAALAAVWACVPRLTPWPALVALAAVWAVNLPFLAHVRRKAGLLHALGCAAIMLVDLATVCLGAVVGVLNHFTGRRRVVVPPGGAPSARPAPCSRPVARD